MINEEILLVHFRKLESTVEDWGPKFLHSFNLNNFFYDTIAKSLHREDAQLLMDSLLEKIKFEKSGRQFASANQFYHKREELFTSQENAYLSDNGIAHKKIFADILSGSEDHDYFRKFLKITNFLLAVYNYKVVVSNESGFLIKALSDNEILRDDVLSYYFFYNRSRIDRNDIGTGKIEVDGNKVKVFYYYRPSEKGKGAKVLKTNGIADHTYLKTSKVLLLKNVIDSNDCPPEYSEAGPIESHFIIKKYGHKGEVLLFGILTSINRDEKYPFSTVICLLEVDYYDIHFGHDSKYSSETLKYLRNEYVVPDEIYYYLYHQSISLEGTLKFNWDVKHDKPKPFLEYAQMPFYDEECRHLPSVAGKYKGLAVLDSEQKAYVLISQLQIFNNGMVEFAIDNDEYHLKKHPDDKNIGFVKYVHIARGGEGKIFLNLRYNYAKQYNTLDIFLEFEKLDRSSEIYKREKVLLWGGFSGQSLITERVISASIMFEEIAETDNAEICIVPILKKGGTINEEIEKLYADNKSLFDNFVRIRYNLYSNTYSLGILKEFLRKTEVPTSFIPDFNEFDVFISIPLTNSNNEKEYEKNCQIVIELRKQLIDQMKFRADRIFSACFDTSNESENYLPYSQYLQKSSGAQQMKSFLQIRDVIKKSKYIFFVYPKSPTPRNTKVKISSSIVEVSYALGLGKKIVVLYDDDEKTLPDNLLLLNASRTFALHSLSPSSVQELFNNNGPKDISQALQLS